MWKPLSTGSPTGGRCPPPTIPAGLRSPRTRRPALPGPAVPQQRRGRQADPQPRVAGQGRRGPGSPSSRVIVGPIGALAGTHDGHRVTPGAQSVNQAGQRHRHAVDVGRVRLGDDADAAGALSVRMARSSSIVRPTARRAPHEESATEPLLHDVGAPGSSRSGQRAQLVGRVQRRDLVALGERRVVEDGLQEVVEAAAEASTAWPMWISSVAPVPMAWTPSRRRSSRWKSILKQAAVVAEDLAARDLAVAGDAGLVGHLLARSARAPARPTMEISGIA